jgi:hypothetical protein
MSTNTTKREKNKKNYNTKAQGLFDDASRDQGGG